MSTQQQVEEKLYYIQDKRSFHGNALIWWGKDGGGYTSNLSDAGKYPEDRAKKICLSRGSDVAWPVDYIDGNKDALKIIVDAQYLDYTKVFIP